MINDLVGRFLDHLGKHVLKWCWNIAKEAKEFETLNATIFWGIKLSPLVEGNFNELFHQQYFIVWGWSSLSSELPKSIEFWNDLYDIFYNHHSKFKICFPTTRVPSTMQYEYLVVKKLYWLLIIGTWGKQYLCTLIHASYSDLSGKPGCDSNGTVK